jgi:hypothetical protein
MLVCTTWKARPLSPDQTQRMMDTWAKTEAKEAEDATIERIGWYINADGSGGVTIARVSGEDAATATMLEVTLALSEFIEIDSNVVLDLETAMPAIVNGVGYQQG